MSSSSSAHRTTLLGLIVTLMLSAMPSSIARAESNGGATNWAELLVFRADDEELAAPFYIEFLVSLGAETGVSSVLVNTGGGSLWVLTQDPDVPEEWFLDAPMASAAACVAETNGTWSIEINGSTFSTTTFTVNSAGLTDGDFFPTPVVTSPTGGATSVAANVNLAWNDPSGGAAEALFISAESSASIQEDNSIFGTVLVTDTSWNPPLDLAPGLNFVGLNYAIADGAFVGPLNVVNGPIVWGDHPIAAGIPGYPASTPLMAHGSYTWFKFHVTDPCPADATGDNLVGIDDFLGILANWGPCVGYACEYDSDYDDVIGITDFLKVLADWGPCP